MSAESVEDLKASSTAAFESDLMVMDSIGHLIDDIARSFCIERQDNDFDGTRLAVKEFIGSVYGLGFVAGRRDHRKEIEERLVRMRQSVETRGLLNALRNIIKKEEGGAGDGGHDDPAAKNG